MATGHVLLRVNVRRKSSNASPARGAKATEEGGPTSSLSLKEVSTSTSTGRKVFLRKAFALNGQPPPSRCLCYHLEYGAGKVPGLHVSEKLASQRTRWERDEIK